MTTSKAAELSHTEKSHMHSNPPKLYLGNKEDAEENASLTCCSRCFWRGPGTPPDGSCWHLPVTPSWSHCRLWQRWWPSHRWSTGSTFSSRLAGHPRQTCCEKKCHTINICTEFLSFVSGDVVGFVCAWMGRLVWKAWVLRLTFMLVIWVCLRKRGKGRWRKKGGGWSECRVGGQDNRLSG